jgi:hypothetical protein
MGGPVADLIARIEAIGGRLTVVGDGLEYEGSTNLLTSDLRAEIKKRKAALVERLRPCLIPALLAHLADHGVWIALDETGYPRFHVHEGADLDGVDEAVIDQLHARPEELVAFLKTPAKEMTDAELEALGFGPSVRDVDWSSDDESYVVAAPPAGPGDAEEAAP